MQYLICFSLRTDILQKRVVGCPWLLVNYVIAKLLCNLSLEFARVVNFARVRHYVVCKLPVTTDFDSAPLRQLTSS